MYARSILLGFVVCLLSGCANLQLYNIKVDSINNPSISRNNAYILFPGEEGVESSNLQFQEFAVYIHAMLARKGYVLAESYDQAEIAISVYYGVGKPEITYHSSPEYGYSGGGTSRFEADTFDDGGYSHTSGTVHKQPEYGVVGTSTTANKKYPRYLCLNAFDLMEYKENETVVPIWKTNAESWGSNSDLRIIFPVLTAAVEEHLGTNTGKKITVRLTEFDERVKVVKSLATNKDEISGPNDKGKKRGSDQDNIQ